MNSRVQLEEYEDVFTCRDCRKTFRVVTCVDPQYVDSLPDPVSEIHELRRDSLRQQRAVHNGRCSSAPRRLQ